MICQACSGTGKKWLCTFQATDCPVCAGEGKVTLPEWVVYALGRLLHPRP